MIGMNAMTPAQAAQQANRDSSGRYGEKQAADPGAGMLPDGCTRFDPPTISVHYEDLSGGATSTGEDVVRLAGEVDTTEVEQQIARVLDHTPAATVKTVAREIVTCHLAAQWMDAEGADAAWEAYEYDTAHPGEAPLFRVDLDDYVTGHDPDDGVDHDWAQAAEDNAAAARRFINTIWRQEEAADRRRASDTDLTRRPAA